MQHNSLVDIILHGGVSDIRPIHREPRSAGFPSVYHLAGAYSTTWLAIQLDTFWKPCIVGKNILMAGSSAIQKHDVSPMLLSVAFRPVILLTDSSTLDSCQIMFTPSVTAHGPRITASPYAPLSLPPVSQTTLVQQLRRDPPALLTNDQTCGYTSGVWSSAVTCGPSHSCTYYTTPYSAPNFGCCINGEECGYVSTCVDYKASGNPNTIGGYLFKDKGMYWYDFVSDLGRRMFH